MTSAIIGRTGIGAARHEGARIPRPTVARLLRTVFNPSVVLGAFLLLAWWAVTRAGLIAPVFLPSPSAVARRLVLAFTQGGLAGYTWVTLREALLGCLAAAVLSLPLAWTLYHSRRFSRAVLPYVAASQAIPAIAIAPLLVVWIGYGTVPTVVLCVLMVFFPITVTVLLGLRGLDTDVIDAARLDGADGLSMLVYMELPMTLPAILSGLRTGFTLSVTGAVIGEMTMGGEGLGMVLASQRQTVDTTGLFSTIVVLCVIATTIHWVLHELERRSRVVASMRGRRAT
ncbi:ABC transporter permease [Actinomyces qiguomingii]|uniref:ABC transporter permease n=1 Tax=Actinomyces qiguomingii TaxID=2057800 RepID=UPI000CA04BB0|nr:ABC transporter permease [Actinomyces qiguomingii]